MATDSADEEAESAGQSCLVPGTYFLLCSPSFPLLLFSFSLLFGGALEEYGTGAGLFVGRALVTAEKGFRLVEWVVQGLGSGDGERFD